MASVLRRRSKRQVDGRGRERKLNGRDCKPLTSSGSSYELERFRGQALSTQTRQGGAEIVGSLYFVVNIKLGWAVTKPIENPSWALFDERNINGPAYWLRLS